jgi:hypothetical protein
VGRSGGGTRSGWAVRHEAERLVTDVFEVVARAARDLPGEPGCGCPVCRTVTAVRDPDPEFAARVSRAVGDVAGGVAGVLRSLSDLGTGWHRPGPGEGQEAGSGPAADDGDPAETGGAPQERGDVGCH